MNGFLNKHHKKATKGLTVLRVHRFIQKTTESIHLLIFQPLRNTELPPKATAKSQVLSIFTKQRYPALILVVEVHHAAYFDIRGRILAQKLRAGSNSLKCFKNVACFS